MTKYIVAHYCFRDDDHNCPKQFKFYHKNSLDDAVEDIILDMRIDIFNEINDVDGMQIIRDYLRNGNNLWIWEWKRRGNGDLYTILTCKNNDGDFDYNFSICVETSKTIGDLIPELSSHID